MKKILLSLMTMAFAVASFAATKTDVLNNSFTGISGTTYSEVKGLTATSGAVYTVQCAGGNSSIQLRSNNNNSGIVTTVSGGKVRKVTITWEGNTAADRTVDIYGSNTAYEAPSDLYNAEKAGTLLGSVIKGKSTELEISGDYAFIGMRSKSGAMYLSEVKIDWEQASDPNKKEVKVVFDSNETAFTSYINTTTVVPKAYVEYTDAEGNTEILSDLAVTYSLNKYEIAALSTGEEGNFISFTGTGFFFYVATFEGDDTYESASASISFKVIKAYDNIADVKADATESAQEIEMTFKNVVVTKVEGNEVHIKDEAGTEGMIYGYNLTFDVGDILNGTVLCSMINFKNTTFEFQGITTETEGLTVTKVATAISTISETGNAAAIYNLAGQKANSLQKGINLVGGKKVYVK